MIDVELKRNGYGDEFAVFTIRFPDEPWPVTFYMNRAELLEQCINGGGMVSDGYHRLIAQWGRWSIFDFTTPTHNGVKDMTMRVHTFDMPTRFLQCLNRIRRHLGMRRTTEYSYKLSVSAERLESFVRRYSQGSGEAIVDAGKKTADHLVEACFRGGDSFADAWERLLAISRNSTRAYYQASRLYISSGGSRDWQDGYDWAIYDPKGKMVMNGGLINHGRGGAQDWSIHT